MTKDVYGSFRMYKIPVLSGYPCKCFSCDWVVIDTEGEWSYSPYTLNGYTVTPPVVPQEDK